MERERSQVTTDIWTFSEPSLNAANLIGFSVTDNPDNDRLDIEVTAGDPPTGTGIPHVVGGVQDAAASLIVNADVHASAAIAGSKLVNDERHIERARVLLSLCMAIPYLKFIS